MKANCKARFGTDSGGEIRSPISASWQRLSVQRCAAADPLVPSAGAISATGAGVVLEELFVHVPEVFSVPSKSPSGMVPGTGQLGYGSMST